MIEIKTGAVKRVVENCILITNPGEMLYDQDLQFAVQVFANGVWYFINDFNRQVLKRIYGNERQRYA